ncbi:Mitochondrial import inner membrane translocase subunit TIM50-like protein [Drosera capensis]
MAIAALRSRMAPLILPKSTSITRFPLLRSRPLSFAAAESNQQPPPPPSDSAGKETVIGAAAVEGGLGDADAVKGGVQAAAGGAGKGGGSKVLKYALYAGLTGVAVTAGYVTYAYTLEEADEKTKEFRESAKKRSVGDDASAIENAQAYLRSAAMTVPAKTVELYLDLRKFVEEYVRGFTEPSSDKLLPDLHPAEQHVFTLVLDLNETLIHSDWNRERGWRTFKRPGVNDFLEHLAKFYEIVLYTDQPSMYVDPVIDRLDEKHCIRYRLSRAATKYQNGKHYRDFSKLNRDPAKILYVSAHAVESSLQPENSVPIKPWSPNDLNDTALVDLIPFLEYVARNRPPDIRPVLASYQGHDDIGKEFIERTKAHLRQMEDRNKHSRFWWR